MEDLSNDCYNFIILSIGDISIDTLTNEKYVILVNARTEDSIINIKEKMFFLISSQCKEIYCIGHFAEILHDAFDDYIADNCFENILTSFDRDTTKIDDICSYFFEAAGRGVSNLVALLDNDKEIEHILKNYFIQISHATVSDQAMNSTV